MHSLHVSSINVSKYVIENCGNYLIVIHPKLSTEINIGILSTFARIILIFTEEF